MAKYVECEALINFLRETRKKLPHDSKDFFTRDEMLLNFEQYVNLMSVYDACTNGYTENMNDDDIADCCKFICLHCGIKLENWEACFPPEENEDVGIAEFELKYCPNCGRKVKND